MSTPIEDRQVIGIDLHRRRSVVVRLAAEGQQARRAVRFANDVPHLRRVTGQHAVRLGPQSARPERLRTVP
jgi:hypothetical protein